MHCGEQPFPHQRETSDLDVALPAGTGDGAYLEALRGVLPGLLAPSSRSQSQDDGGGSWDLVMYNAGVDVHADDSLGMLALTDAGILARDRFVLGACADARVPVAAAIGGGYATDHSAIVARHVLLHRAAAECLPRLQASCSAAARQQRRQRVVSPAAAAYVQ